MTHILRLVTPALALAIVMPVPAAASTIPLRFYAQSDARAGLDLATSAAVDLCGGVPLICSETPTAANALDGSTSASALTDGAGGSQLSLRSANLGNDAFASVWEEGRFASSPGTVVHLHAFLPRITLFGVFFAPDAYVSYDVSIERSGGESLFTTTGVLSEAGFAAIGVDVGAVFDARHHTVTVPPFFVDVDFVVSGCCEFVINLFKSLRLNAANGVEVASGEIIDPFEISSSLRTGFTFTDVAGAPDSASAPEPATLTLLGGALSLLAMRRKRA